MELITILLIVLASTSTALPASAPAQATPVGKVESGVGIYTSYSRTWLQTKPLTAMATGISEAAKRQESGSPIDAEYRIKGKPLTAGGQEILEKRQGFSESLLPVTTEYPWSEGPLSLTLTLGA